MYDDDADDDAGLRDAFGTNAEDMTGMHPQEGSLIPAPPPLTPETMAYLDEIKANALDTLAGYPRAAAALAAMDTPDPSPVIAAMMATDLYAAKQSHEDIDAIATALLLLNHSNDFTKAGYGLRAMENTIALKHYIDRRVAGYDDNDSLIAAHADIRAAIGMIVLTETRMLAQDIIAGRDQESFGYLGRMLEKDSHFLDATARRHLQSAYNTAALAGGFSTCINMAKPDGPLRLRALSLPSIRPGQTSRLH